MPEPSYKLEEGEYIDDDFMDAVALVNVKRRLDDKDEAREEIVISALRQWATCTDPQQKIAGIRPPVLLDLINKRKELRDATNNTLKQSDAGQADSTPSKLNTPRCNG